MLSLLPVLYGSEVIQASQLTDFNQTVWKPYQLTVTVVQAMRGMTQDWDTWRLSQFPALCDCWQLSFRLPGILAMRDMTQDWDTWMLSQFPALCDWLSGILSRLFVIVQQFPSAAHTTTPPPSPPPTLTPPTNATLPFRLLKVLTS